MYTTTNTKSTLTRRLLAVVAPIAILGMALTGCGSTSSGVPDGEYFGDNRSLTRVTVEDGTLTFERVKCSGIHEPDTSIGSINEDGSLVSWTQEGSFSNTTSLTKSEDGQTLTLGKYAFSAEGSDQADTLLSEYVAKCESIADNTGDVWTNPLD